MTFDLIVVVLLGAGVVTGLWTIERHHNYFSDFTVMDLWRCRMDGWLYVLNLSSTAWCVSDIALRIGWVMDVGWNDGGGDKWAMLWLAQHAASAVLAILIHCITNALLNRAGFCRMCQRPWSGRHGR